MEKWGDGGIMVGGLHFGETVLSFEHDQDLCDMKPQEVAGFCKRLSVNFRRPKDG